MPSPGPADPPADHRPDAPAPRASLLAYLEIARLSHWVKNVFVLPGLAVALFAAGAPLDLALVLRTALGLLSIGLVASSNYVLNEVLDAPYDRVHPARCSRPVPAGRVAVPVAYAEWVALGALGVGLAARVSAPFAWTATSLWIMGCVYNVPPVRSKDLPYVDVLSEAVNNPIRFLAGWYLVDPGVLPPASLLLSYWMVGCYFMAIKRFAEFRELGDPQAAARYRRSFAFYTDARLLVSISFYSAASMLFLGAFLMRYRLELILSFPFVAIVMAQYLRMAFDENSAAQAPERLYREPRLMASLAACTVVSCALLFVDVPWLHAFLPPSPIR
jgi:4-hydroxybenzoate polyprenyltransferase